MAQTHRHSTLDSTAVLELRTRLFSQQDVQMAKEAAMRAAKAGSKSSRPLQLRDRKKHAQALAVKKFSWQ